MVSSLSVVLFLTALSLPAKAELPVSVKLAIEESFSPARPFVAYPEVIAQKVEKTLSAFVDAAAGPAVTVPDCSELLFDPEAQNQAIENAGKSFFARAGAPDFSAFAWHLNRLPPAGRAVLYYLLAYRLTTIPRVLDNRPGSASLVNAIETWLVCANPADGTVANHEKAHLFEAPPTFSDETDTQDELRKIFSHVRGVPPERLEALAKALPRLSFTGRAVLDETARSSRLKMYQMTLRATPNPTHPSILEAIYKVERLLGFTDPHPRI